MLDGRSWLRCLAANLNLHLVLSTLLSQTLLNICLFSQALLGCPAVHRASLLDTLLASDRDTLDRRAQRIAIEARDVRKLRHVLALAILPDRNCTVISSDQLFHSKHFTYPCIPGWRS